jgi:hypothetical protein
MTSPRPIDAGSAAAWAKATAPVGVTEMVEFEAKRFGFATKQQEEGSRQ